MSIRFYTSISLLFLLAFVACQSNSGERKRLKARDTVHYTKQEYIEKTLDSNQLNSFLAAHPNYQPYGEFIKNFYRQRDYHYAWINKDTLTEQAGNFVNMMKNDAAFGLQDSTVRTPELKMLTDSLALTDSTMAVSAADIPRTEMMLTAQFFSYGNKVWGGLTSDNAKDLEWFIPRKKLDLASILDSALSKTGGNIESNAPVNPQYKMLRERLKQLAVINEKTKWDTLAAPTKSLKKGDSSALIANVKLRLEAFGDLPGHDSSGTFDLATDTAVRNYQTRMGLKVDGQISSAVTKSLNVPVSQRISQILLNMERLRWVPVEPPKTYILVNIPEFRMHVYQDSKLAWSCNVVVGTPGTHTVVFSNELKYVVFSPYWNVPPGILYKEVLPGIRRSGAGYLARQNMEIVGAGGKVVSPSVASKYAGKGFPYTVRQLPGGKNSLGKVKFLFPNEYNIYLHDTPAKYLFGQNKRSFSHGCIRVEEPKHLAMWLLRNDTSWTEQKIDDAMNASKEKYVTLKESERVPVFIGYFTAWVDSEGRLNFRDDVYGHDAKLAATLFGK
ncbi:MAG: L,D-transpeptidase family protein [Chitinophaga sp.]|uniref:L,D-transpeptidase family protein n=1 Tax=Chitinophaga sp. TaxID=1869181 RepID=UPI0025BC6311|nr:L,D-transpeptidase family protein [Chitinophaga sp.]MBV8254474.1 L,D-transpeptidase family protein [Chitinophaga sp.]